MSRHPRSINRPWAVIARTAAFIAVFILLTVAAYALNLLIYSVTGTPPEWATYVLVGITTVVLTVITVSLMALVFRRFFDRDKITRAHQTLTDAMEQISQGNFNVFIDPEQSVAHHDFAEAINDMAKNLGSLETMRQDFISNVSHEIQSPLTSISGFATLLQSENLTKEQRTHYVSIIESESKRLSSLSDNLLKLSSLESEKTPLTMVEFRLDKQLNDTALSLEPQWTAKNLTIEANLERCDYTGDKGLLSQVWMNVLHNAIKFTPEDGRISLGLKSTDEAILVTISDTGIGIEPEDQMHVFERFYKGDKARVRTQGGSGLGLSLAKKIVDLHAGSVGVESEPGRGTTFTVSLAR